MNEWKYIYTCVGEAETWDVVNLLRNFPRLTIAPKTFFLKDTVVKNNFEFNKMLIVLSFWKEKKQKHFQLSKATLSWMYTHIECDWTYEW